GESLTSQLIDNFGGESLAGCHEYRRSILAMFGLRQEIAGNVRRAGSIVRDYDNLGRSGYRVDSNDAEDKLLCRGDVFVSGTGNLVYARYGFGSEGHCGNRLCAAHRIHLEHAQLNERRGDRRIL